MQTRRYLETTVVVLSILFGCLATAQQLGAGPNPAQFSAPASNCTLETSKPSPATLSYHYPKDTGAYGACIVAKFAAYIKVGENNFVNLKNGLVDTNNSNCEGAMNQTKINPRLAVTFDCGQLVFDISKMANDSEIFVKALSGSYSYGSNNVNFAAVANNSDRFFVTTESGHYYKCNSEQPIHLKSPGGNNTLELVISNFAYEAYRTATGTDFYKIAEECALDSGPFSDGVRIGVGICLIGFVAIILIAYFVGRRRWSQRSSYESV